VKVILQKYTFKQSLTYDGHLKTNACLLIVSWFCYINTWPDLILFENSSLIARMLASRKSLSVNVHHHCPAFYKSMSTQLVMGFWLYEQWNHSDGRTIVRKSIIVFYPMPFFPKEQGCKVLLLMTLGLHCILIIVMVCMFWHTGHTPRWCLTCNFLMTSFFSLISWSFSWLAPFSSSSILAIKTALLLSWADTYKPKTKI